MASINCGHCKQTHGSVAEVRACYDQPQTGTATAVAAIESKTHQSWFDKVGVTTTPGFGQPASTAQVGFIRDLVAKRDVPVAGRDHAEARNLNTVENVLQGKAISKAEASDAITYLQARPAKPTAAIKQEAYPQVPQGHYAVQSATGNNDLDFFRVDRPTEGTWAGRTFVKRIIGGRPDAAVRGYTARQALEAIVAAGPENAARLYGQTIGRCSRCNRHLTDETSRQFGMGPECRSK